MHEARRIIVPHNWLCAVVKLGYFFKRSLPNTCTACSFLNLSVVTWQIMRQSPHDLPCDNSSAHATTNTVISIAHKITILNKKKNQMNIGVEENHK